MELRLLHREAFPGRFLSSRTVCLARTSPGVFSAFAIVAEPGKVAGELAARYGGLVDSWLGTVPSADPDVERQMLETLRAVS